MPSNRQQRLQFYISPIPCQNSKSEVIVDWAGLAILYLFSLFVWWGSFSLHRRCDTLENECVRLPILIGALFGSLWTEGRLSLRGIIGQLCAYNFAFFFTLYLSGEYQKKTVITWFGWSGVVLGMIVLAVIFRMGNNRRR
jgi:hypothetical protein